MHAKSSGKHKPQKSKAQVKLTVLVIDLKGVQWSHITMNPTN